jgi:hypothetical protein
VNIFPGLKPRAESRSPFGTKAFNTRPRIRPPHHGSTFEHEDEHEHEDEKWDLPHDTRRRSAQMSADKVDQLLRIEWLPQ